jgi:hypothetical protein
MSYQKYREMILGKEKSKLPDGVTTKDFSYRGDHNDWYGSIYLFNGEPTEISYYTWDVSHENFIKGIKEQMAEFDGEWEMFNISGGQGHCIARLRKKEKK